MASRLEIWARGERTAIQEDILWLRSGSKVMSPSGEDITASRIESLKLRLEHVNLELKIIEDSREG